MPSDRRVRCQVCGRHESEVGAISWRGKCGDCGKRLFVSEVDQLRYHVGPEFLHWRRRMAEVVGGVLVDDVLRED